MTEQQKDKLIRIYKIYSVVDWIIAIFIIAIPFIFIIVELYTQGKFTFHPGLGIIIPEEAVQDALGAFMYYLSNVPAVIIVPIFIIFSLYTVWTVALYIKVWSIKEIPKGFQYWFDWLLTIALTAYELFIFYIILT